MITKVLLFLILANGNPAITVMSPYECELAYNALKASKEVTTVKCIPLPQREPKS